MAYWLLAPGSVAPHGYSRCWLPPAAAYSHSASLGRNPPSQMQNAYASHQFTKFTGRFALPLDGALGAMLPSSAVAQPGSKPPLVAFKPLPPFKCVCLPDPAAGSQPAFQALTN